MEASSLDEKLEAELEVLGREGSSDEKCGIELKASVQNGGCPKAVESAEISDSGCCAGFRLRTLLPAVLTASILSLLVGTTLSYASPALLKLGDLPDPEFHFNTVLSSIFGVSYVHRKSLVLHLSIMCTFWQMITTFILFF